MQNTCSKAIIIGTYPDFDKHCKLSFGSYVHAHNPRTITNTMASRTSPAIALGPVSNLQGSYRFLCLETKRVITRRQYTELPLPKSVITQVAKMAMKEREHRSTRMTKQKATKKEINDEDFNIEGIQKMSIEDDSPETIETHGQPINQASNNEHNSTDKIKDDNTEQNSKKSTEEDELSDNNTNSEMSVHNKENNDEQTTNEDRNITQEHLHEPQEKTHSYATCAKKLLQFDKVYGTDYQFALILTQMSAAKGIKCFRKKAIEALAKEWKQLDSLAVFKGRFYNTLTQQQRKEALGIVQLIKHKKDGRVKGRTCVNGSRQRSYTAEEDASSPTVSTEALLLTAVIDAKEGREIATCDITGAFLKADMKDFVLIVLRNDEIDALIQANQKYKQYIKTLDKNRRVLYLQLSKAMYGYLKSARLFWEHLSTYFSKLGFTQNQYNLGVANKCIDRDICTVAWHVDDLKVSHKSKETVSKVISDLEKEHGKMSVTMGKHILTVE